MAEFIVPETAGMAVAMGFLLNTRTPLDARSVCNGLDELKERKSSYVGQVVFVKETSKFYKCTSYENKVFTWEELIPEVTSSSSIDFITSENDTVTNIPDKSGTTIINTPNGTIYQFTSIEKLEDGSDVITSVQLVNRVDPESGKLVIEKNTYNQESNTWSTSQLLDMSDYVTSKDLESIDTTDYLTCEPSTVDIGGISKGTSFENKPVSEVLDLLLHPYQMFKLSLSGNSNYYYGTTNEMTLTLSITDGSKPIISASIDDTDVLGMTPMTVKRTVSSDTTFIGKASDGECELTASASARYYYKCYSGINPSIPTTAEEVLNNGSVTNMITGTTYKQSGASEDEFYWIAIPETMGVSTILDPNSFSQGFVSEGLGSITIDGVNYRIFSPNTIETTQASNWYYTYTFTRSAKV